MSYQLDESMQHHKRFKPNSYSDGSELLQTLTRIESKIDYLFQRIEKVEMKIDRQIQQSHERDKWHSYIN
jgi:hypothetical protein